MKGFRERLAARQDEIGSLVCGGLDPLPEKLPLSLMSRFNNDLEMAMYTWLVETVDAIIPHVSMIKPQKAYYEALPFGGRLLQSLVSYIKMHHPTVPVFLDCKRGDISRTQQCYRIAHFEIDGVDGMNFNPYMGKDCMEALVDKNHPDRAIVGLCYTSNPSARQVQDVILADGRRYWEYIADCTLQWANELDIVDNAGLVMAAAHKPLKGDGDVFYEHLELGREVVQDNLWFLIPGIGFQGGFVFPTVKYGFRRASSIALNSSSEILFASAKEDYAEAAAFKAKQLKEEAYKAIKECGYQF